MYFTWYYGQRCTESAVDREGYTIDVAGLLAAEKEGCLSNFRSDTIPFCGIQLSDLACCATFSCGVEYHLDHARFDETGTDGIDSDAGARQLPGAALYETDDGSLGGRVVG